MTTVTTKSTKSIHVADRIHLVADLACSMARACPFATDPTWFWRLAEVEVDEFLWGDMPPNVASMPHSMAQAA